MRTLPALPIDEVLAELLDRLREGPNAVLQAPPGAGKTTRVPPAICGAEIAGKGQVLVLEPRRIAARAAARRIADEQGWTLGREVGWQIRFERNFSRDTRILFVTEGILVQRLQRDPFLEGVGAVLFDEFHERSLFADLSLALVRRVQLDARPELALVPMSATLDGERLAAYLDAPILTSAGRLFPIALEYLDPPPADTPLATLVARAVRRGLAATPGRPARLPARRARDPPRRRGARDARQRARPRRRPALRRPPLRPSRIGCCARARGARSSWPPTSPRPRSPSDGVTGVIDSGWVKEASADPATGLERLALTRISRASAEQRAGRAGRQAPGWCLRLWSEHEHRGLQERSRPEIRRADLAWTALQLAAWGERDLAHFPWFEAPDENALASAESTLARLGAIAPDGITPLGRRLAEFPLHPRLALLVLEGERRGVAEEAALVAALLSDRDPTATSESRISGARTPASRICWSNSTRCARPDPRPPRHCCAQGMRSSTPSAAPPATTPAAVARLAGLGARNERTRLQRAIFTAWADRLARRREPGSDRAVMVGGRGVRLARESAVKEAELFVCVSLDDRSGPRSEALVRIASAVEREWLPPERLREATVLEFEEERQRVVAHRRTTFDDLVLDDKEVPIRDAEAASALLAETAAARIADVLPRDDADWESLIARIRFLHRHCPDLALGEANDTTFTELLSSLLGKAKSFEELRRAPWRETLLGTLSHAQRSALDREAPERLGGPLRQPDPPRLLRSGAAGARGADPGALRPDGDAAPGPRPGAGPAASARPQRPAAAGDRRPRELLEDDLRRGAQGARRALSAARLAARSDHRSGRAPAATARRLRRPHALKPAGGSRLRRGLRPPRGVDERRFRSSISLYG